MEQISMKEYIDPFTGEQAKSSNKRAARMGGRCKSLAIGSNFERGYATVPSPYRA